MKVKPKKFLGQHFLTDDHIAERIVNSLSFHRHYETVIEIGPGMGILTRILAEKYPQSLLLLEIDHESILYLKKHLKLSHEKIIEADFLKFDLDHVQGSCGLIGNFPYNISSQIFFKVLDHHQKVMEVVGMVQKEVAERLCAGPGSKTYGILSVLLGVYYEVNYLFTVEPEVFNPPPRVRSAVIQLRRNEIDKLDCDEKLFKKIVKQGFQNRRKTLRNALKPLNLPGEIVELDILNKRAEQLSVEDYFQLTRKIQGPWKK
jgi:16S rRNA (adenine1518-N6/adenine1519-N6)-dimethyltransferase